MVNTNTDAVANELRKQAVRDRRDAAIRQAKTASAAGHGSRRI